MTSSDQNSPSLDTQSELKVQSESKLETELSELDQSLQDIQKSERRLPYLLFLATFLGSLLGLAADLADATGLLIPVAEIVAPSPVLRIAGSSTILGEGIAMAGDWQREFQAQRVEQLSLLIDSVERTVNVSIVGQGTVLGCQAAVAGEVDLLAASEPLGSIPQCEQQLAVAGIELQCAAEIGYDVIAFVTDINNIVPDISTRDMASILSGSITDWSQVGGEPAPIRVLARPGGGTTDIILQRFTGSTNYPSNFIPCDSNDHCLDAVLSTPGSLYWVSTAWLRTQPPQYLRLILVREGNLPAENPLDDNFNPDSYPDPLIRPLYMYALRGSGISFDSTALAQQFITEVRGVRGQEVLERHHFYTYFDAPVGVKLELPVGFGPSPSGLPTVCRVE